MEVRQVSVVMITYNHARFINRAIESVLEQKTNFRFELVIGEDCSTDLTRKIVFEFQKRNPDIIQVVTSEKNVGMKRNFLRTLRACKGKYIAFCEGDDYWQNNEKLQKQSDYLESNSECGLVFSDYDFYFNSSKKVIRNVNNSIGFRSTTTLNIEQVIGPQGGIIRTCSVMTRRDLLEKVIEGDPYLHQNENVLMGDIQLFAELVIQSQFAYFPESLATYRLHDESATRSKDSRKIAMFNISACEVKLYLCEKYKLSENLRRKIELDWCDCALRLAFYTKNKKLADEVLFKQKRFNLEEWIRYYGTGNAFFHSIYRLAALFRNLFRKRYNPLVMK